MGKIIDRTGQRIGSLTIVRRAGRLTGRQPLWLFRCDCGGETIRTYVSANRTKENGCPACFPSRVSARRVGRATTTRHGEARHTGKSSLYNSWKGMRQRCYSPKDENYKFYGDRGIKICSEWRESFESFRDWANANDYIVGLTVDRIDPTGDYEPSNCEWVTRSVNSKRAIAHNKAKKKQSEEAVSSVA